jgi:hypothetical protein
MWKETTVLTSGSYPRILQEGLRKPSKYPRAARTEFEAGVSTQECDVMFIRLATSAMKEAERKTWLETGARRRAANWVTNRWHSAVSLDFTNYLWCVCII